MRHEVPRGVCVGRARMWLGGKHYVECPDCGAGGRIVVQEFRVRKRERRVFLPGQPGFRTLSQPLVNW
jgi:hypothetical protein